VQHYLLFHICIWREQQTGRVDTDALNLFFHYLHHCFYCCFIEPRKNFLFSFIPHLLELQCSFLLVVFSSRLSCDYLLILIFILIIKRVNLKFFLLSIALYIICSHPFYLLNGLDNLINFIYKYLFVHEKVTHGSLPNIMTTITEAQQRPFSATISAILSNNYINYIGLICFLIAAVFYYKELIPLLPLLLLGSIVF